MCCSVKSCEVCEDSSVSSAGLETLWASYPHSGHNGGIVQILRVHAGSTVALLSPSF